MDIEYEAKITIPGECFRYDGHAQEVLNAAATAAADSMPLHLLDELLEHVVPGDVLVVTFSIGTTYADYDDDV